MKQTTQELSAQIAALTNEFNFKGMVEDMLPNIETLAFLTGHDKESKRLVAKCKNVSEFKTVLSLFPATNTNTVIGTATDKYYCDLNTPYKVNIDNPCSPSQYHSFSVKIGYISNDIDVQCELPIETIAPFTTTGERGITDSEHHYFIGRSYRELNNMRVRQYNFLADQINWYGGDKTLKNASIANDIVNHLTK